MCMRVPFFGTIMNHNVKTHMQCIVYIPMAHDVEGEFLNIHLQSFASSQSLRLTEASLNPAKQLLHWGKVLAWLNFRTCFPQKMKSQMIPKKPESPVK